MLITFTSLLGVQQTAAASPLSAEPIVQKQVQFHIAAAAAVSAASYSQCVS